MSVSKKSDVNKILTDQETLLDSMSCRFCHGKENLEFIVATDKYCVHLCKNCLIYQSELFVSKEIAGDSNAWNHKSWQLMNRLSWRRVIRERTDQLKRFIPLVDADSYSSIRILDIGAGTPDMLTAARNLGVGLVVAMDHSILNCTAIYEANMPSIQGDAEHLPFRSQSFDVITLCQLVEHIKFPKDIIEQVFSLLRPGGIIHIETPSPSNIFSRMTKYRMASSFGPGHVTLYTSESLSRLVESAGFKITKIRSSTNSYGLAGLLVYGLTGLRHKKAWTVEMAKDLLEQQPIQERLVKLISQRQDDSLKYKVKEVVVMLNWAVRISIGWLIGPVWNQVARLLSKSPDALTNIELEGRRPLF